MSTRSNRLKLRQRLEQYAESARLSRQQATIDVQTPIDIALEKLTLEAADVERLRTLYEELEFKSDLQALGSS